MATRSLTEVFILMRNNAIQHRQFFSRSDSPSDHISDTTALVGNEELSIAETRLSLPPEWTDAVEDVQYNISKIQQRLKELQSMHEKHIHRPSLDDDFSSDHGIEALTHEITQMFLHCQKQIQVVNRSKQQDKYSQQDKLLAKNVISSLASSLQNLSTQFRQMQSRYLNKVKSREERSRLFAFEPLESPGMNSTEDYMQSSVYDRGFTDTHMQMLIENTDMVDQRDEEITKIVQSITDLNLIFKDLAQMIIDQGTVLDRIDYNIENGSVQVDEGLKQLQKAESHQKKNRKMFFIIVLACTATVMLILLVLTKF